MAESTGIRAAVTGLPEVDALFKRLRAIPGQTDALAEAVAQRFTERIEFRYSEKVDPNGRKWAPIKPSTTASLLRRASLSGDGSIPGTLLDRHNPGMRSSLGRAKIGAKWMVGFSRPYAIYHEFGTKYMERRGLVFADPTQGTISAADLAAMLKTADAFLRTLV